MLNRLPPRERQIVDLLYQQGAMAVSDICDSLPDRLSGSAVRAMLMRLEDKGFVTREDRVRG
jgi:predicted transcriptional regulator